MSPEAEERAQAVAEETRRARLLRTIVDLTCSVLVQGRLSRTEAIELIAATRRRALELFPDKEQTYEIVLAPRFARLMREFVEPEAGEKVIPFRRQHD